MKKIILFSILISTVGFSQNMNFQNSAMRQLSNLENSENRITLGGYGEINFNGYDGTPNEIDVQRLVLLKRKVIFLLERYQ